MDIEDLQHLSDAQKERYMLLQRGFDTEFWKFIRVFAEANANNQATRLFNAASWDENRMAFGAHQAFTLVANLEAQTENDFANEAASARQAKEDADPGEGNVL